MKHGEELGMKPGVELENASDNICQLAIQGPLALKAMQKLAGENVTDMEYYTFKEIPFAGIDKVIFSTTGYTGSGDTHSSDRSKPALLHILPVLPQ